ncbi:MAG: porin, partial [Roseobacter sp.]|nr:porin [Roseobacter sp.]
MSGLSALSATLVVASPALAGPTYENASGGSFTYYGQFNPAYLSVDDGFETTDEIVDNSHWNSRVGFYLRQPYGENTFQFQFETALGLRQSASVSQTFTPDAVDWSRENLRFVDFSLAGGFGTIYAGQGSMATDGVANLDLSGTAVVTYAGIPDTAGSFQFRTGDGALSGIAISDVFPDFDGGRRGRVRYDTPEFGGGFKGSVAYGTEILQADND